MTTSTLDLIDWDTCLDDEPACEAEGCGSLATHAVIGACGCTVIMCRPCADGNVAWVADALRYSPAIECMDCRQVLYGSTLADIVTVIPL